MRFDTRPSVWGVGRLRSATNNTGPHGDSIEIPRFQRSVVWSDQQRRALIDSIYKGFPIGSLLLHSLGKEGDLDRYLLVDGLQRTTALVEYETAPLAYAPVDEVVNGLLVAELVQLLSQFPGGADIDDTSVLDHIERWMRHVGSLNFSAGFEPGDLAKFLLDGLFDEADADELVLEMRDLCGRVLDDIREEVDIATVELPVIVYSGEQSNLPEIFELLNSSGTQLSKYEIYAATWVDAEAVITNNDVRAAIEAKYQDLRDRGMEVTGLEDGGEIERFNLFEYLFGLGKVLSNKYPLLYGSSGDPAETSPIAFSIATVAHGLRIAQMSKLPQEVDRDHAGRIDLSAFENALMESSEKLHKTLLPYIGLKLNQRSGKPFKAHTDYQIGSMVVRLMTARFTELWQERDGSDMTDAVAKQLPARYLFDILRQSWQGAGDHRFSDVVWTSDESNAQSPSDYYMRTISTEQWNDVLNVWFEEQLQKQQRTRQSVRPVEKIFLKYVYAGVVPVLDELMHDFDIEHLFPVSRLKELINPDEPGWPISCVGNLALFKESLNREKRKLTIQEHVNQLLSRDPDSDVVGDVRPYLFCEIDDVSIPKDASGEDSLSREAYEEFLRDRFSTMVEQLMKVLPD